MARPLAVFVVTVSDRCAAGSAEDRSGPAIEAHLSAALAPVACTRRVVPDEKDQIAAVVGEACDGGAYDLVLTTGGTGFAQRDVTPEAVGPLLQKPAPGIVHAMQASSLTKTPYAWLSRPVAGVRGTTVVITLPGSAKAVVECLEPLTKHGLRHAIELARGDAAHPHPVPPASGGCACGAKAEGRRPDVVARSRVSPYDMRSMPDALALIAEHTPARAVVAQVRTDEASTAGLVLARDVTSGFPHPPFRASIKDGYAVVAADGPGVFRVAGSLCAGSEVAPDFVLAPGSVVRVNTGGPLPEGADAVVQVEDTELLSSAAGEEETIRVLKAVPVGCDIRPVGCDLQPGGTAVPEGAVLNAPEVGLAMSVGAAEVAVYRRPRIAVLSTGDELQPITGPTLSAPGPGKIYDSNKAMLMAEAAKHADGPVVDGGIAHDTMDSTRARLQAAFEQSDVILSTGGVSMGEVDCVKAVLDEMGATTHFGRVNMKPGKPTTFATAGRKLFFALPGNPVSAMVCFHVFVVPALRQWSGLPPASPTVQATLAHDVRLDRERPEYHRCRVVFKHTATGGGFTVESTGLQASHRLLSLAGANGLMVLPVAGPEAASLPAGTVVPVILIGPVHHLDI